MGEKVTFSVMWAIRIYIGQCKIVFISLVIKRNNMITRGCRYSWNYKKIAIYKYLKKKETVF